VDINNRSKMKFILLFLAAFIITVNVSSASLEDLIESRYAAQLRSGEGITQTQQKNPSLRLIPLHTELRRYVTETMNSLGPGILVETLHLYEKPGTGNDWSAAERAGLYNQLLALSTLTGIQYYSESRKAMRTFYESSRVIDGPDTKKPIPDPVYPGPLPSLTVYARQKDLTFGDNIYRYDYHTTPDAIFFVQENLTSLNYGIIQAVGKNRLRSIVAVIDCENYLLIYAASMAKAIALPGMGDRIGASFSNRAEAVLKWFTARAASVF